MATLKLYYIRADAEAGDNLDLFVRADSEVSAITFWKAYYPADAEYIVGDTGPYVREVPSVEGPPGPINWSEI